MKCYKLRVPGTTDLWLATNRSDIWQTRGGARRAVHDAYVKSAPKWFYELPWDDRCEYEQRGIEVVEFEMKELRVYD